MNKLLVLWWLWFLIGGNYVGHDIDVSKAKCQEFADKFNAEWPELKAKCAPAHANHWDYRPKQQASQP